MEDHGLRAHHLLAHQARDIRHRVEPPASAAHTIHTAATCIHPATAARVSSAAATGVHSAAATGRHAEAAARVNSTTTGGGRATRSTNGCAPLRRLEGDGAAGLVEYDGGVGAVADNAVVVAEDHLMGDPVVRDEGAAHFGLVRAALHRAPEGSNLMQKKLKFINLP